MMVMVDAGYSVGLTRCYLYVVIGYHIYTCLYCGIVVYSYSLYILLVLEF